MKTSNWFSIAYFEGLLGESFLVKGLRHSLALKERTLSATGTLKVPRSMKNVIFVWRLLAKAKIQKKQIRWLRSQMLEMISETTTLKSEIRTLRWELANRKSELALALNSLSFYKEMKAIDERNSEE